ncbi:hypothetical protein ACFVHQ_14290 [Actinomycetes bacterium NPDC127524]
MNNQEGVHSGVHAIVVPREFGLREFFKKHRQTPVYVLLFRYFL